MTTNIQQLGALITPDLLPLVRDLLALHKDQRETQQRCILRIREGLPAFHSENEQHMVCLSFANRETALAEKYAMELIDRALLACNATLNTMKLLQETPASSSIN